jgi:hypothetical protein
VLLLRLVGEVAARLAQQVPEGDAVIISAGTSSGSL